MSTPLNQLPVAVYYIGSQQFIGVPTTQPQSTAEVPQFHVIAPCLVHTQVSQDPAKQGEIQVQMVPLYMQELLDNPASRPVFSYPRNIVIETTIALSEQLVQVYRNTLVPPVQPSFEAPSKEAPGAPPVVKSLFD